jgi:heterotetrameric sarcosine oxidase delta subunit
VPFLLHCPHCGPREATEFVYGGELIERPVERPEHRELTVYLYVRENPAGVQREWWFHAAGCGRWLVATRDTATNVIHETAPAEKGMRGETGAAEEVPPAADAGEVL